MTQYNIHISDVNAFKRCRRAWQWSSNLRDNLTPVKPYAPFWLGTAIHAALAEYYSVGINPVEAYRSHLVTNYGEHLDRVLNPDDVSLGAGMLEHYRLWVRNMPGLYADPYLDFIDLERRFCVPMRDAQGRASRRLFHEGRLDGVVRHIETKELYLWEIKTTRSTIDREASLLHDEQTLSYINAAQDTFGEPIAGVIYTLLRKKLPTVPEPLKDGSRLSVRADIDTTAAIFLRAVKELHKPQTDEEYHAIIDKHYQIIVQNLINGENKFFKRVVVRKTQAQLSRYRQELYAVAREMTNERTPIYANHSYHCRYCLFAEPCIALDNGHDSERILRDNYTQNEYHLPREGEE